MTMRRTEIALFLLLWTSFAWFQHSAPGWNVNSRLALTLALGEKGTAQLDDYITVPPQRPGAPPLGRGPIETGDAAIYRGHLYSDKIIGTSLLGVPPFLFLRGAEALRGTSFSTDVRRWVITALSVGLLGAAGGVLLFRLLLLLQAPAAAESAAGRQVPWGPLLLSILTFLGTGLWFYATLFMSYVPALFFLLWGLLRFERSVRSADNAAGAPRPSLPLFSCGLLLGAAVLCEYLAGIAAGFFALYAVSHVEGAWRSRIVALARYVAGALLALSPFLLYTLLIFGRVSVPYEFHVDPRFKAFMSRGLMGATWPDPDALALITVHPYRGLFVHSPWLLAGAAGIFLMIRRPAERRLGILAAAVVLTQLLYNSAYYMWWGGWSFSPRHLLPAIPFLTLGALETWRRSRIPGRSVIVLLGLASVALHLVVNAVEPQIPDLYLDRRSPLLMTLPWLLEPNLSEYSYPWTFPRLLWPAFRSGQTDLNLGRLAGLPPGWLSVFPLIVLWGGAGLVLFVRGKVSSRRKGQIMTG